MTLTPFSDKKGGYVIRAVKCLLMIMAVSLLTLLSGSAFPAEGGEKGAGAQAYEHAGEQAVFHRLSDWFATIGKSPEEKNKILEERRRERAEKRAEKQSRKALREEKSLEGRQSLRDSEMRNRTRTRERMNNSLSTGTKSRGRGKR